MQVDGPGTAYLFFYNKQGRRGLGQDATDAVQTNVEEAFSEWILCSVHFNISLLPLMEAWPRSVAASNCQRLRSWVENSAHNTSVGAAWESDSSSRLVGSAPQQARRASGVGEMTEARLTPHMEAAQLHRRPLKSQCTTASGGFTPLFPRQGAPDSDGYSTVSETAGHWRRCRGHRGSRERKRLAPMRLDMPIFKSTNRGVEVTYTFWHFDVDAFLEQYNEASMHHHIFAILRGYLGKWACTLDDKGTTRWWRSICFAYTRQLR